MAKLFADARRSEAILAFLGKTEVGGGGGGAEEAV